MSQDEAYCKATTKSGEQCSKIAGPSGYCHVHDPEKKAKALAEQEEATRLEKEKEGAEIQKRQDQLNQTQEAIQQLQDQLKSFSENKETHRLLTSVTDGLYIEIEKLTKKAPSEQVTQLALEQINDVIKDTKNLLKADPYIEKLNIFVPAGDLPELRDTLVILRQVKQGLERANNNWNTKPLAHRLSNATLLKAALELTLAGETNEHILEIIRDQKKYQTFSKEVFELLPRLEFPDTKIPSEWYIRTNYNNSEEFNFEWLDSVDLVQYLRVA